MRYRLEYNEDLDKFDIRDNEGRIVARRGTHREANEWILDRRAVSNMGENERDEKRVWSISLGGFYTTTVRLSTGWVGQISGGTENAVWDSEPFEDKNDALKAANDKLNEKLKSLFA